MDRINWLLIEFPETERKDLYKDMCHKAISEVREFKRPIKDKVMQVRRSMIPGNSTSPTITQPTSESSSARSSSEAMEEVDRIASKPGSALSKASIPLILTCPNPARRNLKSMRP